MKFFLTRQRVARLMQLSFVALAACGLSQNMRAEEVAFDDFEGLTMFPFTQATGVGDGTDWTQNIPGWLIDNSGLDPSEAQAYNGWSALDVDSWIDEQGIQDGRDRMRLGDDNNTALVADPDAWDDFYLNSGDNYNSYISRDYDITAADLDNLLVMFDWDFVAEDSQRGVVDVSFDNGTTWQNLIDVASINHPGGFPNGTVFSTNPLTYTVQPTQGMFVSGDDFVVPNGATSMVLRFGCITSGNDWWFAVDNVLVTDGVSYSDFEDFEGLTLDSFPSGGVGEPPGDGTDWTDLIPNWTIDNSNMLRLGSEEAFNGWRALDTTSWVNEQGGQQRSFLNEESIFGARNTALVTDPDAHDDYVSGDDPAGQDFNSYIYRTYNLSFFRNTSVKVTMDWEFRAEDPQLGTVEASFDKGKTWVSMLELDSADPDLGTTFASYLFLGSSHFATFEAPQTFTFGGAGSPLPAKNGSTMILRIGCTNAQNNWWFAVDNILVEADAQTFKHGDANQDGNINFGDLAAFIQALQNKTSYNATYTIPADTILDMDGSGAFTFGDIAQFLAELQN